MTPTAKPHSTVAEQSPNYFLIPAAGAVAMAVFEMIVSILGHFVLSKIVTTSTTVWYSLGVGAIGGAVLGLLGGTIYTLWEGDFFDKSNEEEFVSEDDGEH